MGVERLRWATTAEQQGQQSMKIPADLWATPQDIRWGNAETGYAGATNYSQLLDGTEEAHLKAGRCHQPEKKPGDEERTS